MLQAEFKFLGALFLSNGKMEQEMDQQILTHRDGSVGSAVEKMILY